MIVKPQLVSWRLLAERALFRHLPRGNPQHAPIEDDLARILAGWRGEQELGFHLSRFLDENIRILYDLQLSIGDQDFQIDAPVLTKRFASILEVKNYSGTLSFLSDGQLIRTIAGRREGFPNPLTQVRRHTDLLKNWLLAHHFPLPLLERQVVISNATTIVDNPSNLQTVRTIVTHADQIPARIDQWSKKYPEKMNNSTRSAIWNSSFYLNIRSGFPIFYQN